MYKHALYDIITSFMVHMYTHNTQIYTYALSNVIRVLSANYRKLTKEMGKAALDC